VKLVLPDRPDVEKPDVRFFSYSGSLLAAGYNRIVHGGRGPYVEFVDRQICHANLVVPPAESWRLGSSRCYYDEYRSNDKSYVKVYHQKKCVNYADYIVGMWYMSPFDLVTDVYGELIIWR